MESDPLKETARQVADKFKILGNPDRLCLLYNLLHGEKTVAQLGSLSCLRQPSLSQQLTVLRLNGVVATRKEGRSIFYSIQDKNIAAMLKTIKNTYIDEMLRGKA
ncbi:helix-turn-helix transcriptional regulator [Aquitalea sp. USM4]|uniref:ArsR/SmtB family transcription factor n=1 Tax=Aquitalea sp. USM4 TaxID=1590041 RepID=UPI00103BCCE6|nr:metalloregulator ArsR/SmtB family transcription factor [Aquitalea sp. USM4]QBJ80117.1 transcriptional regulator [Aquitalea sp. USM4]